MAPSRDPLSTRYDASVQAILRRAARESRRGHGVIAWITSPIPEYKHRDMGGRTPHERAFTRSAYYIIRNGPISEGEPVKWSLKLSWGDDADRKPSTPGKLARPVRVRLFRREDAEVTGPKYIH